MARRGKRTVVRAAMGLLSLLAGFLLAARPFTSDAMLYLAVVTGLAIGGLADLVQGTREAPARTALGLTYLLGGGVVAAWPGPAVALSAAVVGVLLIATGALEIWSALLSRVDLPALLVAAAAGGPMVALFTGAVTAGIGAVVLLWADPVVLTMVLGLGARLMLVGAGLLVDIWYPSTGYGRSTERFRMVWRAIALALAVTLATAGSILNPAGVPSAFYYHDISAQGASGKLLAAARSTNRSAGINLLYTTTNQNNVTTTASAVLYVPSSTTGSALPLVVWAHPESGLGQGCAPSVRGQTAGGLGDVNDLLDQGYAVLAPDLPGLGTPGSPSLLIGVAEGRAILDGIRAVTQVSGVRLGRTVIWGHSQGGHAALWAAQLAPDYAPELPLAAAIADEPIANPLAVMGHLAQVSSTDPLADEVVYSYANAYPDVKLAEYRDISASLVTQEQATGCGSLSPSGQALLLLSGGTVPWLQPPTQGPLAERLAANGAAADLSIPLLMIQGADDQVVPEAIQAAGVRARCEVGSVVDYRVYAGLGHSNSAADSQRRGEILNWIGDRMAARTAPNSCH